MMKKDYKKILRHIYYSKPYSPIIITVPEMNYLMISGEGHPENETFQQAAQTLFPIAYVSKFIIKDQNPKNDFVVMPMEVKWRINRTEQNTGRYFWTMMIMQPKSITQEIIKEAKQTLLKRKKILPLANRIRLKTFNEGLCGQIFHIGPYQEQMEHTFNILKNHLTKLNYQWESDSHDIYFNDIRRTPEDKLKTLIRVRIWKKNTQQFPLEDPFISWK